MCVRFPNPNHFKVCIAGKNAIARNALKLLQARFKNDELCIIPNRDDVGMDTWQPSLLKYAREENISVCTLEQVQQIPNLLFLSLEFDRLLRTEQFASKTLYNIHFSALPKYKGVYTSITPLLNGERTSGVTLHCIDNGIDTGDIIAQRIFDIGLQESARDLYFKYLAQGFVLFKENVDSLLTGDFQCSKQDFRQSCYFSRTQIDVKNIHINLKKTSFEIHNQLRAFIFREYQLPSLKGVRVAKSTLSGEFIGANVFAEQENEFILSGIDGFKIVAEKADILAGGGGIILLYAKHFYFILFLIFCSTQKNFIHYFIYLYTYAQKQAYFIKRSLYDKYA
ncbi:formyltransferase family protein [Helicobacter sp. MIT 21-1697]|uniref:formyltransferase family protein n=1 Tax=Helicobacter sp. MIT 21-1697 TaxID=2993733 RepID=UPI00224B00F3|nr:formyltransferase family protein [Helicobacter sp. MIT 21-1697]MCX2717895.1 formyltransferase family protein [Helicobacter sp. MIT 21-1697]